MNFHSNKEHQNIKITVDNWWAVLGSSGFEVKDKKKLGKRMGESREPGGLTSVGRGCV